MATYIRWLGAFRKAGTLHDSLNYELNRRATDEVAVEFIEGKKLSCIHHARVGLLIDNSCVVKKFRGDCWSEYSDNGRLYKTSKPKSYGHAEAWASPSYVGIVCKGLGDRNGEGYANLSKKIRSTLKWYSDLYNLPIYNLVDGKLKKVADD